MSDVRARLEDALREHVRNPFKPGFTCHCGWDTNDKPQCGHVADVLLSLDGIAVVELPKRLPGSVEGERPKWEICEIFIKADRAGVDVNGLLMYVGEARAYAARLLAAANAAEQQGAVQ